MERVKINNNSTKGFTLPEGLIAAAVVVLILVSVISFYVMLQGLWIEGNARVSLQREARVAMEKMVRGVFGSYGIREARDIISPEVGFETSQISYLDLNNDTRSFYLSSDQLIYQDTNGASLVLVDSNIQVLTFNRLSSCIVAITIGMEDTVNNKNITSYLSTRIKLRN